MDGRLVNTAQAADILGVKPGTLRTWRWSGRGPRYVRYGATIRGRCMYRRSDLDQWLQGRSHASTAEETAVGPEAGRP